MNENLAASGITDAVNHEGNRVFYGRLQDKMVYVAIAVQDVPSIARSKEAGPTGIGNFLRDVADRAEAMFWWSNQRQNA